MRLMHGLQMEYTNNFEATRRESIRVPVWPSFLSFLKKDRLTNYAALAFMLAVFKKQPHYLSRFRLFFFYM